MSNQTTVGIEKGYPARTTLDLRDIVWNFEVPGYNPPLHPEAKKVSELLLEHGIEITNEPELRRLGGLSTGQAVETYGDAINRLRHPLGRTGINGTGAFLRAGESATADMAILRHHPERGLEIALAYSRRWGLPGGFCDNEVEKLNRRLASVREAAQEININVWALGLEGLVETLVPVHVKPNSKWSVDMGYITTQVEMVILPDWRMGEGIKPGDDAKAAGWFTREKLYDLNAGKTMSADHFNYAQ